MRARQSLLIAIVACAVAAAVWFMSARTSSPESTSAASLPIEGRMPSLEQATAWLNSEPLSDASLRGKVVLVEFWTYTCINWRRQLPYVRAWAEKYKGNGLVVVGVHTPEFEFEKNIDNVRPAVGYTRVGFPVAVDSDYAIWNAFANRYWPALYFVDAKGDIRHHQFGEGEYERSERVIQQLLVEAGSTGVDRSLVSVNPDGAEAAADWNDLGSPENYLGYDRTKNFASPGGIAMNSARDYSIPENLGFDHWALAGNWTIGHQATTLNTVGGKLRYRFHARDVHLVMGPSRPGAAVRFRVLIDGQPPGAAHGVDVDEQGIGTITESRMYQLVRQPKPIVDRTFEIEFLDPGVEVFAFTFG